MKRYIKLLFCVVVLLVVVGCSDVGKDDGENNENSPSKEENESPNNENTTSTEQDKITEKNLVKNLIEESKKYLDTLPKEHSFTMTLDKWNDYRHHSRIMEGEHRIDLFTSISNLDVEFESGEEDYKLSSGLVGQIGFLDEDYIGFIGTNGDVRTEINIGTIGMEESKRILDNLEFREEDITEAELKKAIDVDYENVKYFNNLDTEYDVSQISFATGEEKYVHVRYRKNDTEEYDAVDVYASKKDFKREEYKDTKTVQTTEGKTVDIMDDGFYVEWFWDEDDGYKYRISGNFDEEDVDKKDYMLEVIDNMTKVYGE